MNPLYIPPDIDEAHEKTGANCGPIALAAFAGIPVLQAMPHFGRDWPGFTNATRMKVALSLAGFKYRHTPSRQMPESGVAWIELVGPWSAKNVPIGAQLAHSHWVSLKNGRVFDPITTDWRTSNHWECSVAQEWIETTNRAIAWRVRTGLEVSPC